jgi:hypothetical protein
MSTVSCSYGLQIYFVLPGIYLNRSILLQTESNEDRTSNSLFKIINGPLLDKEEKGEKQKERNKGNAKES